MTVRTQNVTNNIEWNGSTWRQQINNELTRHSKDAVTFGAHVDDLLPINVTFNPTGVTNRIVVAETWSVSYSEMMSAN